MYPQGQTTRWPAIGSVVLYCIFHNNRKFAIGKQAQVYTRVIP